MTTVYETAAQTAVKIRAALKAAYPGVRFLVTSRRRHVIVRWTDGPLQSAVARTLSPYEASVYSDYHETWVLKSYAHDANLYSGAEYLSCYRTLSPENEVRIRNRCRKLYGGGRRQMYSLYQMEKAELSLLAATNCTARKEKTHGKERA